MNDESYSIPVRLPRSLVDEIKRVKEDHHLPTIAAALEAYLHQQIAEKRELEFAGLKQAVHKTEKNIANIVNSLEHLAVRLGNVNKILKLNCATFQIILGGDNKISERLRTVMCGKNVDCPLKDFEGLPRTKVKIGIDEHIA